MSESHTLATLTAALQQWVEEDTPEYNDNLELIIQRGELKLLRDLDLNIFDVEEDKNTASGDELLEKPADIVSPRTLSYTVSGERVFLLPKTLDYVRDYGGSGNPLYYADLDEDSWALAPVPASTIAVKVHHIKRPESLVDDTDGTFLSTRFGDALFYACILSAEEFLQADDRLGVWRKRYDDEILPAAKMEAHRLVRSEYGRT